MPRAIRHEYPGAVYHVMSRGNNGQEIFRTDQGRRLFLETLAGLAQQTGWRFHAYVFMSNHYHLLLETPEANLVAGMKWFQGTYTQRFNAMFQCRGHLFQGRYKALPIELERDPAYFRAVAYYIHLNPFRAGLAGTGMDQPLHHYQWSSYPFYSGARRQVPDWLELTRLLNACGLDPHAAKSRSLYRQLIEARMRDEDQDASVGEQVTKQLNRGWFVGGESFRTWLAQKLPKHSDNLRGEQRRAHDEMEAERLLATALSALKLSEDQLLRLKKNQPEKQAVAWLLKQYTTVTGVWIAKRLDMGHRSNVSRALTATQHAADRTRKELRAKMMQCTG